jgi:hypothetical protein
MRDYRGQELFLISILAAFCSGLAWTHDHELFAAAFAAAALLPVFGCIGSETRPEEMGGRRDGIDVNRTHFLYRIDMWTIDGEHVIEHLAGIEDFQLAMVTYRAACTRWPGAAITLRQGAKVIEDNRRERTA